MIIDWSRKLRFERFLLPGEFIRSTKKLKGIKKGKKCEVLQYIPDKVLLKVKGGREWFSLKNFKKA